MAADGSAVELDAAVAALQRALADPAWGAAADPVTLQRLLGAAVVLYGRKVAQDGWIPPFGAATGETVPTAGDVCLAATQMLDAVSVEIFELALWKSWAHGAGEEPPGGGAVT